MNILPENFSNLPIDLLFKAHNAFECNIIGFRGSDVHSSLTRIIPPNNIAFDSTEYFNRDGVDYVFDTNTNKLPHQNTSYAVDATKSYEVFKLNMEFPEYIIYELRGITLDRFGHNQHIENQNIIFATDIDNAETFLDNRHNPLGKIITFIAIMEGKTNLRMQMMRLKDEILFSVTYVDKDEKGVMSIKHIEFQSVTSLKNVKARQLNNYVFQLQLFDLEDRPHTITVFKNGDK